MFTKRFSLESAYATGGRIVINYFTFFFFASTFGIVACAIHLMVLGVVDFFALRYHIAPLIKMFQNAFNSATGPLHHAGFTVRDAVSTYLPSDLMNQTLGRDTISFDISGYDIMYILSWVVPTALVLKFVLDMISVGWTKIALDLNVGKAVSVRYLYQYYYLVPRVFLVNLIVGLATIAGFLLFLLPGIFIYQRFRFAKYFIIDKNLGMFKALQSSWAITDGAVLQLFGFSMISLILESLGNLIVVVSFFITPLQNQVEANVYTQLVSLR